MNFNLLANEHLFEFINFIFVCVCVRYLYKKYGAPVLAQAIHDKKAAQRALKQSVALTQQHVAQMEQDILDQETYGTYLVSTVSTWFKKEEEKKHRTQQECLLLKQQFDAYFVRQEKAVVMMEVQKEVAPQALRQARQQLMEQYQDAAKQRHAVAHACQTITQGNH